MDARARASEAQIANLFSRCGANGRIRIVARSHGDEELRRPAVCLRGLPYCGAAWNECQFDESMPNLPCPNIGRANGARANLLAGVPVLRVPQRLETSQEAEQVLEVHQPSLARRHQRGADRIAADHFAEAITEADPAR